MSCSELSWRFGYDTLMLRVQDGIGIRGLVTFRFQRFLRTALWVSVSPVAWPFFLVLIERGISLVLAFVEDSWSTRRCSGSASAWCGFWNVWHVVEDKESTIECSKISIGLEYLDFEGSR